MKARRSICICLLFSGGLRLYAAEFDESKLPPPATNSIEFTRDVRPLLETSCLRCHGPEKPKSGFRLDNRAAALKGGEQGVDILPGNSAQSPLIHYVSYLVEDIQMPPPGKGDQLTAAQVSLLRAWIDQGAAWDAAPPTNQLAFSMSPTFGWTFLRGDGQKFRELYWQKEGANGGLEHFEFFEQKDPDTKVSVSGHALLNDYKIVLMVDRQELGFIHTGWEQYRKYFDDTGGYLPSANPSAPSLGRDLHLDLGKAWIDFGLTLPNWPQMVFGYEYDYKEGNEASTSWGRYPNVNPRNVFPVAKSLNEGVHVIKFDLNTEYRGVTIEERFRGEYYSLNTHYTNLASFQPVSQNVQQSDSYFQGANTLRLDRKFSDWLYGSAGYLYSKLNADSSLMNAVSFNNLPFTAQVPGITLEKESHVFNLNALLGPFDGLTLSAGAQGEQTRQSGLGGGNLNSFYFTLSAPAFLAVTNAALASDYDQRSISESAALRYSKIPFTVLFAEARLQQQRITQSDSDIQAATRYLEAPEFTSYLSDFRGGFSTSPWKNVSFTAHYRRHEVDSRYGNTQASQPVVGYPGHFLNRDVVTDEVETKLTLRPRSWLKTSFGWQYLTTDYWNDSNPVSGITAPGGNIQSGESQSKIYTVSTTLTPTRRLSLNGTFSYQPTATVTASGPGAGVVPYRGNIYSVMTDGAFVLNQSTDLFAGYSFSKADYGQNNFSTGVPVGMNYQQHALQAGFTRRLSQHVSARLQYAWYQYQEPSSGNANNFTANAVFATLTCRFR